MRIFRVHRRFQGGITTSDDDDEQPNTCNEEKHAGLPQREIRDALGKLHREHYRKCHIWDERGLEYLEQQLKELQEKVEAARMSAGLSRTIKALGWQLNDVSDHLCNYDKETYFEFIGTEEEADAFREKNLTARQKSERNRSE